MRITYSFTENEVKEILADYIMKKADLVFVNPADITCPNGLYEYFVEEDT